MIPPEAQWIKLISLLSMRSFLKTVSDVYVAWMLSCRSVSVSLHVHGTLVALCKVAFLDAVSLCINEMHGPQGLWCNIGCADKFCFCSALCVELLFGWFCIKCALPHHGYATCVACHVAMQSVCSINPCFYYTYIMYCQGKGHVDGVLKVPEEPC